MFYYYIKIAFKNLWNNKKYSAINIAGFSFSICIFLAIILYIIHEKSFDKYHTKSERIYRLIDVKHNSSSIDYRLKFDKYHTKSERIYDLSNDTHNSSSIDYRVKDVLMANHTEINNVCLYQQVNHDIGITYNETGYYIKNISSADAAFFEMFDFEFIRGNQNMPFDNINSAIITESNARMLFGEDDPIGKELILRGREQIVITGVIADLPSNSSFETGLIVNAVNDDFKFSRHIGNSDDLSTYRWPFRIYLELKDSNTPSNLLTSINQNIDLLHPYIDYVGLIPLHDLYLYDSTHGSQTKRGNPSLINLLLTIALIILILAAINFVNLSISQQQKRGKEIGVRKTIGASKKDLVMQFLFESIIVIFFAFGVALILYELLSPVFDQIFRLQLSLKPLFTISTIFITIFFVLSLGILSGIWPAILFSAFNPVNIFSKRLVIKSKKSYLKNALTIFQFAVSISLIFCVIVIWKQIDYTKHKDLGFNKDHLLRIDIPQISMSKVNVALGMVNELRSYTHISDISLSNGVPGQIRSHMGANMEGKDKSLAIINADSSFLKTFDIEVLQGRDLLPGDFGQVCMINQTAMDYFEWDNLDNKRYNNGREGGFEVIGVVEDFHISSFHHAVEPLAILFRLSGPSHLTLKISGQNIGMTMDFIRKSWKESLPEYPLEYQFYDDWFNSMYVNEERFGKIIGYFSLLGIIISCIGILGLAIFNAERKTKEIGIRKVNGASVGNVIKLLTKEYALWVLIAFVIASPIAYFLMQKWLQAFAYKTDISWWIFMVTGLTALTIAWLSVIWHSLKAALRNPVDALRYE